MNELDKAALKKIEDLRDERDDYKTMYELVLDQLHEREDELRVAKAMLAQLRQDRRVEVA